MDSSISNQWVVMSFIDELKRRNVFRVGAAYAVVAWLILQVIDIAFPRLGLPDWTITLILVLLLVGFPIGLILAWAFELSPDGVKKTEDAGGNESVPAPGGYKLNLLIVGALVAALGFIAYQNFGLGPDRGAGGVAGTDKSVAVLPFDDLSEAGDQAWFSDGLTEEILNSLARLPELKVISRTSSFFFRDQDMPLRKIAERLDVAHIVEGSVRRSGNRFRVTAQLIRAADDSHIWTETYDASTDDVFSVQEEVAEKIAMALDIFLDDAKREAMFSFGTRNVQAWELYSKASRLEHEWYLTYGAGDKLWQVSALTEQALEIDPNFLAARFLHVTAYTHFVMGDNSDGAPEGLTQQMAQNVILEDYASAAALAQHPTHRAFFNLSRTFYSNDWSDIPALINSLDMDEVQNIIQASISGHAIDNLLSILGRKQDAFDYLQEALRRSPYDPSLLWHISGAAFGLGGPDLAFEYIDKGPEEFVLNYVRKTIYTLIAAGRAEEALLMVEKFGDTDIVSQQTTALVLAHAGREKEARAILEKLGSGGYKHWIAAWALETAGDLDGAKSMYRSVDANPGGPQTLMMYATSNFGGKFFHDLTWTPNLAARLAEAGVEPERLMIPESQASTSAEK